MVMLGPLTTFRVKPFFAEAPPLSVTVAVKLEDPVVVGVPVIAPVEFSESPAGKDPLVTVQV